MAGLYARGPWSQPAAVLNARKDASRLITCYVVDKPLLEHLWAINPSQRTKYNFIINNHVIYETSGR